MEAVVRGLPGWEFHVAPLPGHSSPRRIVENARRYMALYGPAGFLLRGAQMILLKLSAALRLPTRRPHSAREAARRTGARMLRIDRVNSPGAVAVLKELEPHFILSIACPQILRRRVLEIPSIAALNVHSALLPENRGMLPTFWSLAADPPRAGVTLHLMTTELDGGGIILQREIPVDRRSVSLHALISMCKRTGAELAVRGMEILSGGGVEPGENDISRGSRRPFPSRRDVRAFLAAGGRIW